MELKELREQALEVNPYETLAVNQGFAVGFIISMLILFVGTAMTIFGMYLNINAAPHYYLVVYPGLALYLTGNLILYLVFNKAEDDFKKIINGGKNGRRKAKS